MALNKFLNPRNDLAFKRIFGSEKNKDILIHFLNDIFDYSSNPIEDVTYIKTQLEPEIEAQRVSVVDILCKTRLGERFIVEMQVAPEPGFEKRAQYYASRAYIEQRSENQLYRDLKAVTFLAISNFKLFSDKKEPISHHHILDIKTHERDLKDFSFSFIELPKFKKTIKQLDNIVDKWLYFFKSASETTEEDLAKIVGSDLVIKKAYKELDRFRWTADELRAYETSEMNQIVAQTQILGAKEEGRAEGIAEGEAKGKAEGIAEGEAKGKAEGLTQGQAKLVQHMSHRGMTVLEIIKITGLSEIEIKRLLAFSL